MSLRKPSLQRWIGPRDTIPPGQRGLFLYGYLREAWTYFQASLCSKPPPKLRFLVVCQPRTGSQYLCDLLNSHPHVRCEQELLGQPVWNSARFLSGRSRIAGLPGYGLKVKPFQLRYVQNLKPREWLLARMAEGWKVIHLRRENLLRRMISGMAARVHRRYHRFPGQEILRLKAAPAELLRSLPKRLERDQFERLCLEGLDVYPLAYKDALFDARSRDRKLARLLEWLELPVLPLHSKMLPNTPAKLEHLVENYSELKAAIQGTELEKYLED